MRPKLSVGILPSYVCEKIEKSRESPIRLPASPPLPTLEVHDGESKAPRRWKFGALLLLCCLSSTWILLRLPPAAIPVPVTLPLHYSKAKSHQLVKRFVPPVRRSRQAYWRDSLLPDVKYIIGGPAGGTANQFHGMVNMAHLAGMTKRVAILILNRKSSPTLEPGWVTPPTFARYSEFWDLERFTDLTGIPLIEMADLRENITDVNKPDVDHIGCWSNYELSFNQHWEPNTLLYHDVHLDLWPMPPSMRMQPEWEGECGFTPLAMFDLQRSERDQWLESLRGDHAEAEKRVTETTGRRMAAPGSVEPSDQLLCMDSFFYMHSLTPESPVFSREPFGHDRDSWTSVGQFMHWTPKVEEEVDVILDELLGSSNLPFVAIHMRRGDFGKDRGTEVYVNALEHLYKDMLKASFAESAGPLPDNFDPRSLPVVVVTDDTEGSFRSSLSNLGWLQYSHELAGTVRRLGPWWPSILDSAILSRAHGIVGTPHSTYSYQAILRAQAWQGAASAWAQ